MINFHNPGSGVLGIHTEVCVTLQNMSLNSETIHKCYHIHSLFDIWYKNFLKTKFFVKGFFTDCSFLQHLVT